MERCINVWNESLVAVSRQTLIFSHITRRAAQTIWIPKTVEEVAPLFGSWGAKFADLRVWNAEN